MLSIRHRPARLSLLVAVAALSCMAAGGAPIEGTCEGKCDGVGPGVQRFKFRQGARYLLVEVLRDDVAHFELSAVGSGPDVSAPLWQSPMVAKRDYPGPSRITVSGSTIETAALRVEVDGNTLCVTATDTVRSLPLTTVCP